MKIKRNGNHKHLVDFNENRKRAGFEQKYQHETKENGFVDSVMMAFIHFVSSKLLNKTKVCSFLSALSFEFSFVIMGHSMGIIEYRASIEVFGVANGRFMPNYSIEKNILRA